MPLARRTLLPLDGGWRLRRSKCMPGDLERSPPSCELFVPACSALLTGRPCLQNLIVAGMIGWQTRTCDVTSSSRSLFPRLLVGHPHEPSLPAPTPVFSWQGRPAGASTAAVRAACGSPAVKTSCRWPSACATCLSTTAPSRYASRARTCATRANARLVPVAIGPMPRTTCAARRVMPSWASG